MRRGRHMLDRCQSRWHRSSKQSASARRTCRRSSSTAVLTRTVPTVDPNLQIGRTREAVVGIDHQLAGNLHASVDYAHRYTDFGSAQYVIGTQPGARPTSRRARTGWARSTTPTRTPASRRRSSRSAPAAPRRRTTRSRPRRAPTDLQRREPDPDQAAEQRWQGNVSFTWNDFRQFTPPGAFNTITGRGYNLVGNPTNNQFADGFTNNTPAYTVKGFGSYELP